MDAQMSADLCLYQQKTSWNSNLFRLLKELCSPWLPGVQCNNLSTFVRLGAIFVVERDNYSTTDQDGHFII